MKFKCGPTQAEREVKEKAQQEKLHRKYVWKRWFAWYPVKVNDGDCRWLEFVERRPAYILYTSFGPKADGAMAYYIDYSIFGCIDASYKYRVIP